MTKTTDNRIYKSIKSKELQEKFAYIILQCMDLERVKEYVETFPREQDFNIYQYGCLDIFDYDIYKTLYDLGLRTNAVMNFHNIVDKCSILNKHRGQIRDTYKRLIRYTVQYILENNNEG